MADTHETIADIIAEKRLRAAEMEKTLGDQHSFVESLKDDADRIEAAWKREKSVIEADALSAGGLVQAMRQKMATTEKSSAVGDCAKLREALFASRDFIDRVLMFLHGMETTFPGEDEIIDKIRSALDEAPKMAPDPRSHIFKIKMEGGNDGNE